MIARIIEFSANNPFVVFTLTAITCIAGLWSVRTMPLDAIPDLSDTQVIVYTRWDRSPDIIEDQVTYPLVTAMLGAPKVKPSAASPTSATPTCTSYSRTERTCTGRA